MNEEQGGVFIIPVGYWDHPIPQWMATHPNDYKLYPSKRQIRRIMRAARKAGWDSTSYDEAVREMQDA